MYTELPISEISNGTFGSEAIISNICKLHMERSSFGRSHNDMSMERKFTPLRICNASKPYKAINSDRLKIRS